MPVTDSYRTIKASSSGIYKEKGSKFIGLAFPVSGEDEVKKILAEVRKEHHDARHHCYAYMLGPDGNLWRANDDGEPSGTGGKPILGQIRAFNLKNVLIVVPRYFGGTLLGTSGLINAYKSAAEDALSNAEIIDHIIMQKCLLRFPYPAMNSVMKVLKDEDLPQADHSFELTCMVTTWFRLSDSAKILSRLEKIEGLEAQLLEVY